MQEQRNPGVGPGRVQLPVPGTMTEQQVEELLRRRGPAGGLGALAQLDTVGTAQLDDGAVTPAKLAPVASSALLGSTAAGPVQALTAVSPGPKVPRPEDVLWFWQSGRLWRCTVQDLLDLVQTTFGLSPP
jgi:hypothetical protein